MAMVNVGQSEYGRGLVATTDIASGNLFETDAVNSLCIDDDTAKGGYLHSFGK